MSRPVTFLFFCEPPLLLYSWLRSCLLPECGSTTSRRIILPNPGIFVFFPQTVNSWLISFFCDSVVELPPCLTLVGILGVLFQHGYFIAFCKQKDYRSPSTRYAWAHLLVQAATNGHGVCQPLYKRFALSSRSSLSGSCLNLHDGWCRREGWVSLSSPSPRRLRQSPT